MRGMGLLFTYLLEAEAGRGGGNKIKIRYNLSHFIGTERYITVYLYYES